MDLINKHIKMFEQFISESISNKKSDVIDITYDKDGEDVYNVSGVVHYVKDPVQNWLYNEKAEEFLVKELDDKLEYPVAILKNMNVREGYRNQGYGGSALDAFIEKAYDHDAKTVILISDELESNEFDLTKWYESKGFEKIGKIGGFPLMKYDI